MLLFEWWCCVAQDKLDDARLGLKSAALSFGENSRKVLTALSVAVWLELLTVGWDFMGPTYFALACGGGGLHLAWQLRTVDFDNARSCARVFRSNKWFAAIVLAGIVLDRFVESQRTDDKPNPQPQPRPAVTVAEKKA